MRRALVIVNPRARHGDAAHRYEQIRAAVEAGFQVRHVLLDASGDWLRAVDRARREGFDRVVAVGGDGTVHAVANALLSGGVRGGSDLALAAVGMGSSNDFHKPVCHRVHGIPIRISAPAGRDVGLATWKDDEGAQHSRWFVVSASIGLTARANRAFARARTSTGWLGARSASSRIACAALGAIARHRSVPSRLRPEAEGSPRPVELSNLSVMLTPHLAGSLRYGSEVQLGHGRFAVHLCEGMSKVRLLSTMAGLLVGRFGRSPGTRSWSSRALTLDVDEGDDLELDGELVRARAVRFEAFSNALAVCA